GWRNVCIVTAIFGAARARVRGLLPRIPWVPVGRTVRSGTPSPTGRWRRAMRPDRSMRLQIGTLVVATSAVQLANGFFGTFISLRVSIENFGATMAGLVLSSYFAGFTLGAFRCGR